MVWLILKIIVILILIKVIYEIWSPTAEVQRLVLKFQINMLFLHKYDYIIGKDNIIKNLKEILNELKVNKYATKEELLPLLYIDDLKSNPELMTREELIFLIEKYLEKV